MKNYIEIRREEIKPNNGLVVLGKNFIVIKKDDQGKIFIERIVGRNKVKNIVSSYEYEGSESIEILDLDENIANKIVDSIIFGKKQWSDAFIIQSSNRNKSIELNWEKTEEEHKFTSTGIKFWRHKEQMQNYKDGKPQTVISTHISPEGACNLKCPYCSVTYRDTHSRIDIDRIKNYVLQLKEYGLKAVILTGGGEPTLYNKFNELVQWLHHEQNLKIGLITNGTNFRNFKEETYPCFDWIRISINVFDGWEEKIGKDIKLDLFNKDCVIGCSMVYTVEHQATDEKLKNRKEIFDVVSKIASKVSAEYIRILPNCLLEQEQLIAEHNNLFEFLKQIEDKRFFQQYKIHNAPKSSICHQSYFRPYLSEEPYADGEPGTVYPCDSVVLNDSVAHFSKKYQVCKLEDIGKFLEKKIEMKFSPKEHCEGCVFTGNVNMLEDWKNEGKNEFDIHKDKLKHEEFI